MAVPALSWYAYVSIVARTIVTVGAALEALTGWGRAMIGLVRRLVRARRDHTGPAAAEEPTEEQRAVLNAVLQHFLERGTRAPFRQLDKELDHVEIELRKNAESMPPGLLIPDVRPRGGFFYPDDELMVTLEGLRYCYGSEALLDLLAQVLAYLARRERAFMPSSNEPDLVVNSKDVRHALGLSSREVLQVRHLLDVCEPSVWISATWEHDGEWTLTLDLERVRRFRGVENGDEYLQVRAGETLGRA
jgi:hypothetical protein